MLARLRVLLPFEFSVPQGSELMAQEFECASYHVRILPPCRAAIDPTSVSPMQTTLLEIAHSILPAKTQALGNIQVDGVPSVQANLFQVDFIKAEFDRRRSTIAGLNPKTLELGDPPITLCFSVLNGWMNRYRYPGRSPGVRPIRAQESYWALEYLTDDEKPLPEDDPALFRFRTARKYQGAVNVLDRKVWDRVGAIPLDFSPAPWEILVLDAFNLLPESGPAVVLAYSALESFIDHCLDKFAGLSNIPPELWEWINTRDSFWLRPRTDEQFDVLLHSLTGRSLKNKVTLWESFKNLRAARHSFVHTGRAKIGNDELTPERATGLVQAAEQIIVWVEDFLPEHLRRRDLGTKFEVKMTLPLAIQPPIAGEPTK